MLNDWLMQRVVRVFPTARVADSTALAALWRVLFYMLRPQTPFMMQTRHYRLWADPRRGNHTRAVIRRGTWERIQTRTVAPLMRPGDHIIDVGANFGHYAMMAANLVGPGGHVTAFEPHPDAFARLRKNAALQPFDNLTTIEAAVGARAETLNLISHVDNPGGHSFVPEQVSSPGEQFQVPVLSVDGYLAETSNSRPLDFLKIDVEGFELKVLQGAARTIDAYSPIVFCEICPFALRALGDDPDAVLAFFQSRDYTPLLIFEIGLEIVLAEYRALRDHIDQYPKIGNDIIFLPAVRFDQSLAALEALYPGLRQRKPVRV